jgi:RNA recognition motif-containing protein
MPVGFIKTGKFLIYLCRPFSNRAVLPLDNAFGIDHADWLSKIVRLEDSMDRLFVGNIPHASSEMEVQHWVEGKGFSVATTQIIRDRSTGQSRGFGFVELEEESKIHEAIAALNGQRLGGRVVTVNRATPLPYRDSSSRKRAATP